MQVASSQSHLGDSAVLVSWRGSDAVHPNDSSQRTAAYRPSDPRSSFGSSFAVGINRKFGVGVTGGRSHATFDGKEAVHHRATTMNQPSVSRVNFQCYIVYAPVKPGSASKPSLGFSAHLRRKLEVPERSVHAEVESNASVT